MGEELNLSLQGDVFLPIMLSLPSYDTELLYPWGELSAEPTPRAESLGAKDLPEPYGQLLAHPRDMTSTLEAFHRQGIRLQVLDSRREGSAYLRRVLLVGKEDGSRVELGAIRIELKSFSPPAREVIIKGQRPLGGLLADFAISYTSQPRGFFRLWPNAPIVEDLGLEKVLSLYGRRNILISASGKTLAEVVEILPPTRRREPGFDHAK